MGLLTITFRIPGVPAEERQESLEEENFRQTRRTVTDLQRGDHLQRSAVHAELGPNPPVGGPDDQPG